MELSTGTTTTHLRDDEHEPRGAPISFRVKRAQRTRTESQHRSAPAMARVMTALVVVAALALGQVQAFARLPPPLTPTAPPPPPPAGPPPTPAPVMAAAPTAAPSSAPSVTDDGFGLDQPCDENWNQTAVEYRTNLDKWGDPDCYVFTIQRSCFCTDVIRNATEVTVVNGTIVSPPNYEELFLMTMDGLFEQVNDLCVKKCPERGAARCDISYGPQGNLASVFIDRSLMIADEEISYTITKYRKCPASPGTGNARDRSLLRRSSA